MREFIHSGQLKGHKALVVGGGVSGVAAARLLAALGASAVLADRREDCLDPAVRVSLAEAGVVLEFGEHRREQFADKDLIILSPGVPVRKLAPFLEGVPANRIMAEMELASWFVSEKMVAITGSNGKTTTTTLIGRILEAKGLKVFVGGNIGTPLAEYVLSGQKADVLVLEVSSFQLQNCRTFRPHVGVLLNFSPNHLDFHADMEEYLSAKLNLFARQKPGDLAILPLAMKDDLEARPFTQARRTYFVPTRRFSPGKLLGEHNLANLEAAWLAVQPFGVTQAEMQAAIDAFEPLSHRLQTVGETGGVLFVDDSKSTTIDSTRAALRSFDRPVRLLAGGVFKGGDLTTLLPDFAGRVVQVGLFGASREIFEAAFAGAVDLFWEPDLDRAVRRLYASARPGDVILLSPGTASFDLYASYKARGDHFQRIFADLAGPAPQDPEGGTHA